MRRGLTSESMASGDVYYYLAPIRRHLRSLPLLFLSARSGRSHTTGDPYPLTTQLATMAVWGAAKGTIDTLRDLGMEDTCFIGGLAARLYGNDREPNVSVDRNHSVDAVCWFVAIQLTKCRTWMSSSSIASGTRRRSKGGWKGGIRASIVCLPR